MLYLYIFTIRHCHAVLRTCGDALVLILRRKSLISLIVGSGLINMVDVHNPFTVHRLRPNIKKKNYLVGLVNHVRFNAQYNITR